MADIISVWRQKCRHATELRQFKAVSSFSSLETVQKNFLCHEQGFMEIALAQKEEGPWTTLDIELHTLPIGLILKQFPGTKYVRLTCIPGDLTHMKEATINQVPQRNINDVLMENRERVNARLLPAKKTSSSGVVNGLSRKDDLYNDIVDWMKERGLFFRSSDEAKYVTLVLTNSLWYITNQHSVINDRSRRIQEVKPIPATFDPFQGFNEFRRKKLKAQPLESVSLKSHSDTLLSLCMRPIMKSTAEWETAYNDIKLLAESLLSYHNYLERQKRVTEVNRSQEHPARPISDNISVFSINSTPSGVNLQYNLLDKAVALAEFLEPVFFDENLHLDEKFESPLQRLRYFENLQLSVTVDVFKYCPGGGIVTIFCIVKVRENRTENEKSSETASVMAKINSVLPEYHTRTMKRQFKDKIKNIAVIQPSVVDLLYKELTPDASASPTPEMEQRLRMIFMGETGLLTDLRKLNQGRPNEFDEFFLKLEEVIENFTAADERRHNVAHMSEILSLKDLINQAKEKCPDNTPIPSSSLVRLQFTPRNPYTHAALKFTSRFDVQYKIQRRQLRLSHPDDHYCSAQFKYLRTLAVKLKDDSVLFCCDDKAKVSVGQPELPVSTGVRGKKTLAPTGTTLIAADHDVQHSGSITPSVYLQCEIPDSVDKSFYRGNVTATVNDSVFQSSNPMRHGAALVEIVRACEKKPKVLMLFTDGGADHRNTLEKVKCAAICLFKELNLDYYIAARCAPGQSWTNPAERVMSLLNIALQNTSLSREKMTDNIESKLKNCGSMDSIRKVAETNPELKEEWEAAVEPVRRVIENRFRRLALKEKPVKVHDPIRDDQIDNFTRHLDFLFPGLNTAPLVKSHTSKFGSYNDWLERHSRQRQYSFQLRKCNDKSCCPPMALEGEPFWLPDPVLDQTGEHFKNFNDVIQTETTEKDRPTYRVTETKVSNTFRGKNNAAKINLLVPTDALLEGEANLYTAQNARSTITCTECEKPRVVYSKTKLTERQNTQLAILMSEFEYSCGSPLTPPKHQLHGKVLVRLNLTCNDPMETSYYSSTLNQCICYYCGGSQNTNVDIELKTQFKTVLPLCKECKDEKGLKPACFRPFGKSKK